MTHLPTRVMCSACRTVVSTGNARRLITLWARLGKGGSLSGIKDQQASETYRCDDCVRLGRFAPAEKTNRMQELFDIVDGKESA